jgi:hypothetical protein
MNKTRWIEIALTASLLIMVSAVATQATVLRAFVSSTGKDANIGANCVQATPCKTFNVAIAAVTPGGELIALDTSGYGPIANINKAITIAAVPGATAFVVAATGTAGFTVNGGATDMIVLRNINFNGANAANTIGVQHNSGQLVIENCRFTQLNSGLSVSNATDDLIDCNFYGNTTAVDINSTTIAVFENCRFELSANDGIDVQSGAKATLHNCVLAGNSGNGLYVTGQAMIDNCQISRNGIGIFSGYALAQVRVSNSNITNNTIGVSAIGAILSRISNGVFTNTLEDNGTNGNFTGTYSAK